MKNLTLQTLFVLSFFMSGVVFAQSADTLTPTAPDTGDSYMEASFVPSIISDDVKLKGVIDRINRIKPAIDLNQIPSLFFTPSEQSLIAEARLGFTARPPTDAELRQAEEGNIPMGPRELSLGGIIYASAGDWTIWLNGQKVTPDRLPPEILDIKVRKSNIKLKWFDAYTNQIFPIKLRSHQRFNIDTRIFLPGEAPREVTSTY